jgi:ABC-type Fe3+-hydroxamate transport system substrate-binding protein
VAERTTDVAAVVAAEAPGVSVSVLTGRVGAVLAVNASGAVGALLTEVGVTRPDPQQAPGAPGIPFVPVAGEQLTAHDADVLLLAVGEVFDVSPITGSPLYPGMGAVAAGAVHDVVGDHWVLGGSGFASWWMLADLEALVSGNEPATIDDTRAQWTEFLEVVA